MHYTYLVKSSTIIKILALPPVLVPIEGAQSIDHAVLGALALR
jgi:hypothetical protein